MNILNLRRIYLQFLLIYLSRLGFVLVLCIMVCLLFSFFWSSIWTNSVLLCSNFSFVHKMVYRYLWCSSIYLSETDRGPFWYCWQFQGQQLFASSKVIYFDTWRSLVQCITQGLISMRVWLTYILVAYLSGSIGLNETCKWTKMG